MTLEDEIIQRIEKTGYKFVEGQHRNFSSILKRNIFLTGSVFALTKYKPGQTINDIISNGRSWNFENLNSLKDKIFGTGVNLIIFHHGELILEDIKGKSDKGGDKKAILQSISIVDLNSYKIEQDHTWVLLPVLKETIKNIANY